LDRGLAESYSNHIQSHHSGNDPDAWLSTMCHIQTGLCRKLPNPAAWLGGCARSPSSQGNSWLNTHEESRGSMHDLPKQSHPKSQIVQSRLLPSNVVPIPIMPEPSQKVGHRKTKRRTCKSRAPSVACSAKTFSSVGCKNADPASRGERNAGQRRMGWSGVMCANRDSSHSGYHKEVPDALVYDVYEMQSIAGMPKVML
jgi:hypothetical protein